MTKCFNYFFSYLDGGFPFATKFQHTATCPMAAFRTSTSSLTFNNSSASPPHTLKTISSPLVTFRTPSSSTTNFASVGLSTHSLPCCPPPRRTCSSCQLAACPMAAYSSRFCSQLGRCDKHGGVNGSGRCSGVQHRRSRY